MKANYRNLLLGLLTLFVTNLINTNFAQDIKKDMEQELLKQKIFIDGAQNTPIESNPKAQNNIIKIPKSEKAKVSEKYFGYDYFLNREFISIYDNLPIPDHYQLGPGDEIVINIWGSIQLQSNYIINRDGNVFIDKLGQLSLIGKTLTEADDYLKKRFESVFSSLAGKQPEAFFDLTIGKLKSININIIGETSSPGIHSLHPFSTISTALIQSGGIKSTGSLRSIKLIRNNSEIAELDFYNFLISGKKIDDFRLLDGDVIFIPLRFSKVEISGEVNSSGIFELKSDETLGHLFEYCGGLKYNAQNIIEIDRIIPIKDRNFEDYAYQTLLIKATEKNFLLMDGDKLILKAIMDVENFVDIVGMVKNPGKYPFIVGSTIMDILALSGGLNDKSFINKMDLDNVELVRSNPDNEYPLSFKININEVLGGDQSQNILLQNWDIITIRRNIYYDPPERVILNGEIQSPGKYTLLKNSETIQDVIFRAGGFTSQANQEGIKVFREGTQIILKDLLMPLIDGDKIIVPQFTSVVEVIGEVYHPGFVEYEKNKKLKYYINRSGGFMYGANKNATMIIYANGDVKVKTLLGFPEIKEGSKIIIQKKEEKEEFDITEFLKETTSILVNILTIIFVIQS